MFTFKKLRSLYSVSQQQQKKGLSFQKTYKSIDKLPKTTYLVIRTCHFRTHRKQNKNCWRHLILLKFKLALILRVKQKNKLVVHSFVSIVF